MKQKIEKLTGVGLRAPHFSNLENEDHPISWLEIITENYLGVKGPRRVKLKRLLEKYRLSCHGVSLNIAAEGDLDSSYLKLLCEFVTEFRPDRVSDHLCWTGTHAHNFHDLIPFPYTQKNLEKISLKVEQVQESLDRPLILENLSSYLLFKESEMSEYEFMNRLCQKTGCQILLDLNNLYVNSINHNFDAKAELFKIDLKTVGQIHIAGHEKHEKFLIDTHSRHVSRPVWELFRLVYTQNQTIPFCLEWDADIPHFSELLKDLRQAQVIIEDVL